jgi:hypothetical protein
MARPHGGFDGFDGLGLPAQAAAGPNGVTMTAPPPSRSIGRSADKDLLARLWRHWLDIGRRMPAELWTTSSGLGDWTVRELYAHVSRGVSTLAGLAAQPPAPGDPDLADAAAYFAALSPLGATGAAQVAEAARQWAASRPDDVLVGDFDRPAAAALDAAGDTVVRSIAGTIRMTDYLLTRILEATVHLLDLGQVVPGAGVPPAGALHRTVDVLADLTPPADFVRLATGRPAAAIVPVLT